MQLDHLRREEAQRARLRYQWASPLGAMWMITERIRDGQTEAAQSCCNGAASRRRIWMTLFPSGFRLPLQKVYVVVCELSDPLGGLFVVALLCPCNDSVIGERTQPISSDPFGV